MCDTLVASGLLGGFRSALVRCVGVWRQIDVVARGFRLGSWLRSADSVRLAGRMTVVSRMKRVLLRFLPPPVQV